MGLLGVGFGYMLGWIGEGCETTCRMEKWLKTEGCVGWRKMRRKLEGVGQKWKAKALVFQKTCSLFSKPFLQIEIWLLFVLFSLQKVKWKAYDARIPLFGPNNIWVTITNTHHLSWPPPNMVHSSSSSFSNYHPFHHRHTFSQFPYNSQT